MPVSQTVHALEPNDPAYDPTTHDLHDVDWGLFEKKPGLQLKHKV